MSTKIIINLKMKKMYLKLRDNCVFCESTNIKTLFVLKHMPVFIGIKKNDEQDIFSDMTFTVCEECHAVQIKEIVDPSLVYMNNHNTQVVGELWKNHYIKFSEFILDEIQNKLILEIGDPSFKLSGHLSKNTKEWIVVEMNPDKIVDLPENTTVIEKYFDSSFNMNKKVDVVLHSHFFEHILDPTEHLKQVYNILNDGGKLIFSTPNLERILKLQYPPNNVLSFEHTFYFDKSRLEKILNEVGFKIEKTNDYLNHSIFLTCVKSSISNKKYKNEDASNLFVENLKKYQTLINNINDYIHDKENVYLYGCHISSQFMINQGLDMTKVQFLLDNSESKIGNKLYGTNLITKSPEYIKDIQSPVVIVNHMSIYADEIKKQLKTINESVILL